MATQRKSTCVQHLHKCKTKEAAYSPRAVIEVKLRTAKRTHVSLGHANIHVNPYNESPSGRKCCFQPPNKNIRSLPLGGILAVKVYRNNIIRLA